MAVKGFKVEPGGYLPSAARLKRGACGSLLTAT